MTTKQASRKNYDRKTAGKYSGGAAKKKQHCETKQTTAPLVAEENVENAVWHKRSNLVMRHNAVLCDKCFWCNADAQGGRHEQRVKVNAPTSAATAAVSLIGLVAGTGGLGLMLNRQSMNINIGICHEHAQLQKKMNKLTCIAAVIGALGVALALQLAMPTIALAVFVVATVVVVVSNMRRPAFAVNGSNDDVVLLRGCSKKYLANFPKYTKRTW